MTKVREIYRCQICGNVVEVVNPGAVLSCCGEPMKLMKENTSDGAKEKHVPVIEPIEGGYRVTVGSVEHPMLPEHYIQWIELLTPTDVLRHELNYLPDQRRSQGCYGSRILQPSRVVERSNRRIKTIIPTKGLMLSSQCREYDVRPF